MPFDMLRPRIKGMTAVESWYRRNILLYIAHTAIPTLSPALFCTAIADDQAIPVMASFGYRMRACALYCLPARLVSRMARIKHRLFIAFRWLRNR